jgi:putative ABC transport system permease protein
VHFNAIGGDYLKALGVRMVIFGAIIGVALALAAGRATRILLYGIPATDSVSFLAALIFVFFVSLIACLLPGFRAMRIDPVVALRQE